MIAADSGRGSAIRLKKYPGCILLKMMRKGHAKAHPRAIARRSEPQ